MAKANTYPDRTLVNVYGEDVSGAFGKQTQPALPLSIANGGNGGNSAKTATKNLSAPYVLAQSAVQNSVTTGTTETVLATVTIPAGMLGTNGRLRCTALFGYTNSANIKTCRMRITDGTNSIVLLNSAATTTVAQRLQVEMANRNATNSQVAAPSGLGASWGATGGGIATGAMDTTLPLTLTITGQTASSGETCSLEEYLVEIFQSAGN